jgi:hypothetical protein
LCQLPDPLWRVFRSSRPDTIEAGTILPRLNPRTCHSGPLHPLGLFGFETALVRNTVPKPVGVVDQLARQIPLLKRLARAVLTELQRRSSLDSCCPERSAIPAH